MQKTIASPIALSGYGVHSGTPSSLVISPAPADNGIVFRCQDVAIAANYQNRYNTSLCTAITSRFEGRQVVLSTIEHLMGAITGLSIDNLFIDVFANELPIFDGSALPYVKSFSKVDIIEQAPRKYLVVKQPVRVETEYGFAEFLPYNGTIFDITINFSNTSIGSQNFVFDMSKDNFARHIAPARTFGFVKDIENLWASGLALGSSMENSVVIGERGEIVNTEGLRFANEPVRHKLLDAMGDTALLGGKFKAIFRSYCSGHSLNLKAVEKLVEMSKIA